MKPSEQWSTLDGTEAAASVAFRTNEVIAIYPITPSSGMGELSDAWAAAHKLNIWGNTPLVQQMQSEGGAAGAVHGSLQAGALTTTFTASQGLLLMIPNMYKIAGELTSTVFHIAARSLAAQGLSIFGDHSDVMAARATGWAMLFAGSVQEVMDFALVSQASTLKSRVPFLHAFDGFRTSHEVNKVVPLSDDQIRALIDQELINAHRDRALNPDKPFIRGTAQNPDVYFQGRETVNPYYAAVPGIVEGYLDRLAEQTGRKYSLYEYAGAPDAERVIIAMGSGIETIEETVDHLNASGEKVGLVKIRLFRPFAIDKFVASLPSTVRSIAVLDRTKEPGSTGEPLYQDVVTAIAEAVASGTSKLSGFPKIVGGRYGLASKEFTPAMVKAVFDEIAKPEPKNHFTVGIFDDVSHTSIDFDPSYSIEMPDVRRALFYGLGADGTVGANKNSVKIIGEETKNFAQAYFVYDSKKSGAVTVSHLRFGPRPIRAPYLIEEAHFVAVHQFGLLERYRPLERAMKGATVLINSPFGPNEVWDELPVDAQEQIVKKGLKLFVLDAYKVAHEAKLGVRINTIMQTAFFKLSGVLPEEEAISLIKKAIKKTYMKRGQAVIEQNFAAVDEALKHLHPVSVPSEVTSKKPAFEVIPEDAPDFIKNVTGMMIAGRGDEIPVSMMPADGTYPSSTSQYEKRGIATALPEWDPDICIQCGKCVLVCPHAAIRAKIASQEDVAAAPTGIQSAVPKWKGMEDGRYILKVSHEDCTGCSLCAEVCPAKDRTNPEHKSLDMKPHVVAKGEDTEAWDFFMNLSDKPKSSEVIRYNTLKNVQLLRPLFEFSGACSGCGETPYIKLLSQLFGEHTIIANATGCSSIFGGNLPTTPYTVNKEGRGPAWANSLFEDNAEFGMGMRLALDAQNDRARKLLQKMEPELGSELVDALRAPVVHEVGGRNAKRVCVEDLKSRLRELGSDEAVSLLEVADSLVEKSVWIIGGDGWAYDIGFGGLDHVLASGSNVKVLVLDTEVYSNTGGQASKSTSRGAVAKFASGGKRAPKKDLGRMAMSYGNVYVAQVSLGANDAQVLKAFLEAEAYPGPAIIIAYSHCIAHGIDVSHGLQQQKKAVDSGYWPLYRFDPRRVEEGLNPLQLDSKTPTLPLKDYLYSEGRFKQLIQADPDSAAELLRLAQEDVETRWAVYQGLAESLAHQVE